MLPAIARSRCGEWTVYPSVLEYEESTRASRFFAIGTLNPTPVRYDPKLPYETRLSIPIDDFGSFEIMLTAPPMAPSPYIREAGPFKTSMRSRMNVSTGRLLCELLFWRIPSRMMEMSLPLHPRVEYPGMEPTPVLVTIPALS